MLDFSSEALRDLVFHALAEDLGLGDLTTRVTLPGAMQALGTFNSKQRLVVVYPPERATGQVDFSLAAR